MMKNKQILLVHRGWFHPSLLARWYFKRLLQDMSGYSLTTVNSLESAEQLGFKNFQAVVVFIHAQNVTPKALSKLSAYVSTGGGLIGVHSATASFKQEDRWFELIGGRFSGHGPIETIHYQKFMTGDPAFREEPDFWIVDELYRHDLQPGVQAVYRADFEGQQHPLVWTYHFGEGRVFYACPGHKAAVFHNAIFRQVLRKGVDWVCGL